MKIFQLSSQSAAQMLLSQDKNDIPKMTKFALELLIKNKNLEDKFTILKKAHKILSE